MKYPGKESSTVEFKKEIPTNNQIIKTIIGFCNHKGGKLIIGVADDGLIIGVDEAKMHEVMEFLEKTILEASHPPIIANVYAQRITDKVLLIIEVSEGMNKPYFIQKEGAEKGVYMRFGRNTLRATRDVIQELKWAARGVAFDNMPVYQASRDDIDMDTFSRFLDERRSAQTGQVISKSLDDALASYHIITKEHGREYPTVTGILLFGKNPQNFFPEARIMCNHFPGIEMGPEVVASKECLGTLDEQFKAAYNFVVSRLNTTWKIVGPKREEQLEIPPQAIREMVMNAIIHRNYHIPGPNKIAIFDNRIEIFSQGGFPGPTGENLRSGFIYLRNMSVCKIFREMGLIENFGYGFVTTFASYEKAGLKEPQIIEGTNFVKCILPRRTKDNERQDNFKESNGGDSGESAVLNFFSTVREIAVSDIINALGWTRPTATRRLSALVKKGVLKRVGSGRGVRYVKA